MIATAPTSDLERFANVIWRDGDVREVRIPTPGRTDAGYFDNPAALVEAVGRIDGRNNIYVTVNPVDPALLARAANRIKSPIHNTTGDAQIVERRWLPIDIDPVRVSGVSATEEEREAALAVSRQVWGYLNGLGWPEPVAVMSGNGYWLLYPIELPNDDESKALVDGVLVHLSEMFNSPAVSIDTTVSNASRIVAMIGTLKVKGDVTSDRPHRRSGLLRMPAEIVPVPRELLAALKPTTKPRPLVVVRDRDAFTDRMPAGWVRKLLDAAGIAYRPITRKGREWYRLDQCPFHPDDDQGGDCAVGEDPDGKALGKCLHNRGSGKTWQDFKVALGLTTGDGIVVGGSTYSPREPEARQVSIGIGVDAVDLLAMDLPPLRWIVPDLIPEGTTVIAAPPKVGKSCFVYQVAVETALGGNLLGRRVERGSTLYLALEDGKRRGQARLTAALRGRSMPRGFLEVRWDAHLIGAGLEQELVEWLDGHPDAVLVAIDTLQKVRPQTSGKRGAYEVDVDDLGRLQTIFRDRRVALLIVHHARKDSASDDFLASVSGTYGITGSVDTIVVIRRKRLESFGQVYVTGRDVEDAEVPVKFDGMLWSEAPLSLTQTTFERREVLADIEANGPVFPAAVAERTGLPRTSVQNMVGKLVEQGAVARTARGYIASPTGVVIDFASRQSSESSVAANSHQSHRNVRTDDSSDSENIKTDDSLISITDDSDDSVIGVTGDTRARGGWLHPCRDYVNHQTEHRQTPDGWTCFLCHPEDTPA